MTQPFERILVANRGVIARRIVRTCQILGIPTAIAVPPGDPENAWISGADHCVEIPNLEGQTGYLNAEALIQAAQNLQAAIHPGYGFLSERAEFRALCDARNVPLIAPSQTVLDLAGHKAKCLDFLEKKGIPLIPRLNLDRSLSEHKNAAAEKACLDFAHAHSPLLLKPARGGGGLGMSLVSNPEKLLHQIEQTQNYAHNHYADASLILEKYLPGARHVEVQLLGDAHGNLVHLFERECSLQRRRQKVIEESPAAFLSAGERAELWQLALDIGRAIGLDQVATVEFLWHQGQFYFLEINPRIQVEHAVTEEITGEDLIAWQIRIAQGASVQSLNQAETRGCSIEARIYAENPLTGFPCSGRVDYLQWPDGANIRIETGIQSGSDISSVFDPLLLKMISWGTNRNEARLRLIQALNRLTLVGLEHNTSALLQALNSTAFTTGQYDTTSFAQILSALDAVSPPDFISEMAHLPPPKPIVSQTESAFWRPAYMK